MESTGCLEICFWAWVGDRKKWRLGGAGKPLTGVTDRIVSTDLPGQCQVRFGDGDAQQTVSASRVDTRLLPIDHLPLDEFGAAGSALSRPALRLHIDASGFDECQQRLCAGIPGMVYVTLAEGDGDRLPGRAPTLRAACRVRREIFGSAFTDFHGRFATVHEIGKTYRENNETRERRKCN